MKKLEDYILTIPDFPEPGVMFRDVTGVLDSAEGLQLAIEELYKLLDGVEYDTIAGVESRGFIFGAALANNIGAGCILIRKPGKLPAETISEEYSLEYGTDKLEMHKDAIEPGKNVVVIDDLLATGGTVNAACKLLKKAGANVKAAAFIIELTDLNGRKNLPSDIDVVSMISYEGK